MFSKERLKNQRTKLGLSQTVIANELGVNRTAYHNWESGKSIPNQKNLAALSKILMVPIPYFESEFDIITNYLQLSQDNQEKADNFVENLLDEQRKEKVIPLFAVEVLSDIALSAGFGESIFNEYETEIVYSEIKQHGYDIATWIKGDSMEPVYQSGEVALIRTTGFDYDGAVYALSWNGSVYIKKLYKEGNGFRMVSLNHHYPDKWIPFEDNPQIVGIVVSHFMPVVGG